MNGLRLVVWLMVLAALLAGCGGRPDEPAILFLRPTGGGNGAAQLFLLEGDGPPRQLTGLNDGDDEAVPEVIDYAPSPDGARIVYTTQTGNDTALRLMDGDGGGDRLLLDCPGVLCAAPVWAPDGRRLLFERWGLDDGDVPGPPRLTWLDPATGATAPLIEGDDVSAQLARFSPDGEWLSYFSPADEGIVLYHLASGEQRLLVSRVGQAAAWSPDSAAVVYGDVAPLATHTEPEETGDEIPVETAATFLYRSLLAEADSRQRLSPEAAVADSAAAFAPDGQWIAFGRAPAETGAARQLWLMRPDGREARALTNEPAISHGPPSWSPDGRTLLYQRVDISDPAARPAIWRLNAATGAATLVVEDGYWPAWLP
jgi:TolB protein